MRKAYIIIIITVIIIIILALCTWLGVWYYKKNGASKGDKINSEMEMEMKMKMGGEHMLEKFGNDEKCGYDKGEKDPIDISKDGLKPLFIRLNGIKYTWLNAPIKSIRLTNFDFDKHTVHVVINDTEPECRTIVPGKDSFKVKKALFDKDLDFSMMDGEVHIGLVKGLGYPMFKAEKI